MGTIYFRHNKDSGPITCLSAITTTIVISGATTTRYSSADVNCKGYGSGLFITRVAANASSWPLITLDAKIDTTYYARYVTIQPDLTTTANNYYRYVGTLPDTFRVSIRRFSTTTHCRLQVKALFKCA